MSAETDLNAALLAAAPVTALVGTGNAARIYPDVVPQDVKLPAIAFVRADTEYLHTIHSDVPVGEFAILEIACMGTSRAEADDLAGKAIAALGAARFGIAGRRAEIDVEQGIWATIVTVRRLQ